MLGNLMPRAIRSTLPAGLYHLTSRGTARRIIFIDDLDRSSFIRLLGNTVFRFRWICCGYCLMGNHYHLLVDSARRGCPRECSISTGLIRSSSTCVIEGSGT